MAIKVHHNKEISGGGKNGRGKGVSYAIRQKRTNMGSINVKKRKRKKIFNEILTAT